MKTVEQKAKAYDEALERMKSWVRGEHPECFTEAQKTAEFIFPELKESEDERIRKAIMEFFELQDDNTTYSFIPKKDILTWLEKQGKHLENYDEAEKEKADFVGDGFIKCHADFLDFKEGNTYWLEYIGDDKYNVRSDNLLGKAYHITPGQLYTVFKKSTWIGKRGEKKSADKVDPKFHEGEWVVYNHDICQIVKREEGCNKLVTVFGIEKELVNERNLSTAHLWTIQDAKDGDVLVASDGSIFLFAGVVDYACKYYAVLTAYNEVKIKKEVYDSGYWETSRAVRPATKEQRDLLFQKMAEAGYEWNASKKELKKIEQKSTNNPEPKFYEEDWITMDNPCQIINIDNRGNYIVQYCNDEETHVLSKNFCESHFHLWTIQDAKDGDVLVGKIDGDDYILIFKQIKDGWIETYGHYYGVVDRVCVPSQLFCKDYKGTFYPTTKELCDFLFSKMKEAGYEWDADKKELKIVDWSKHIKYNPNATSITEEKPAWTEEDTKKLYDILSILGGGENCFYNSPILIDWLKSLKERIGG